MRRVAGEIPSRRVGAVILPVSASAHRAVRRTGAWRGRFPGVVLCGLVLLLGITPSAACKHNSRAKTVDIRIGDVCIKAEIACTPSQRRRGLMFRKGLARNGGMLFVFPKEKRASFWMKNTRLPLDLAYIGSGGTILQVERLRPHDLRPVRSRFAVKYALEVRRGFFARHKIGVGERIVISDEMKALKVL